MTGEKQSAATGVEPVPGVHVAHTEAGEVILRLPGPVPGLHLGIADQVMTPDEADLVTEALTAQSAEARRCLDAAAEQAAAGERARVQALVNQIPVEVPPQHAHAAARAILAAFDVTPKETAEVP